MIIIFWGVFKIFSSCGQLLERTWTTNIFLTFDFDEHKILFVGIMVWKQETTNPSHHVA